MNINIFGSTGVIGTKVLKLIDRYDLKLSINLLVCKQNYKKLIYQINKYKPKYVYIENEKYISYLKKRKLNTNIILSKEKLDYLLLNSKTNMSILSIDGISALKYLNSIIKNTDNLGLVNKECIVSAGHLFSKSNFYKKTNIYPLDSEHFSLFKLFNKKIISKEIKKIYITASGGSFYKKKIKKSKIKFQDVIDHPKWKMGIKNSIDSSTLANKCLEIIEAKYLFNIDFEKIDILIHPESLVHSIIEYNDYTYTFNYFFNDMNIPLLNFLFNSMKKNNLPKINEYKINKEFFLSFESNSLKNYPIYNLFKSINNKNPRNLIKFNLLNEFAVNLFINGKLQFDQIPRFIKENLILKEKNNLNSINKILDYNDKINNILNAKYTLK